jgi:hypothetical protein
MVTKKKNLKEWARVDWARNAVSSHANMIDYGKKAKIIVPDTQDAFTDWYYKGGHKKYDFEGKDHPIPQAKKVANTHYKYATASSARNAGIISKHAEKILLNNFTRKEIRQMGKIIFSVRPIVKSEDAAGMIEYRGRGDASVITIDDSYVDDEDIFTHELVHARLYGTNTDPQDRDIREKMTDFETIGRISHPEEKRAGYYQYIKNVDEKDAIKHDRILLTGSMMKNRKGDRFVADVRKKYNESMIKDAHFSPAEKLDRYYQVILPDGEKISIHQRGKPNAKVSISKIIQNFKKRYGRDIKVYEWRDGKRVLLRR